MSENKYVSLNRLSDFLENSKKLFATKDEIETKSDKDHDHTISDINNLQEDLDIIETLALINKAAIEANTSALEAMKTDIDALAAQVKLNEESLANFVAVSSQEINTLF